MVQAIVKVSKYRTFVERITWDTPNANANANVLIKFQRQTNIKVSFNDLNDFSMLTLFTVVGASITLNLSLTLANTSWWSDPQA